MSDDELLVSDAERERVLTRLRGAAADGRLTLEDFSNRSEAALSARTQGELVAVTRDLPMAAPSGSSSVPGAPSAGRVRTLMAILGSASRRGRWRAEGRVNVVSLLGNCLIDLREAEIRGDEIVFDIYAALGSVDLYVPKGVRVELEDISVLGSSRDRRVDDKHETFLDGPVVRVRGISLLGSVTVSYGRPDTIPALGDRILDRHELRAQRRELRRERRRQRW